MPKRNYTDVLKNVRPNSARAYTQTWNDLAKYLGGEEYLASLSESDVRAWVDNMLERKLSASTIRTRLAAVAALFDPQDDPTRGIERPTTNVNETIRLTPAEITRLIRDIDIRSASGSQDFALLSLLLLSGWNVERVTKLTWGDFTIRHGRPHLRVDVREYLPIPQAVWAALAATARQLYGSTSLLHDSRLFVALAGFPGNPAPENPRDRSPLSPQEVNRRIDRYAKLAGLEAHITSRNLAVTGRELGINTISALLEKANSHTRSTTPTDSLRLWRSVTRG